MKGKKGKELFFPAALKLIYTLLTQPQNVNAPYRDLATDAGVAIGTITRVFAALRDQGYLMGQERKRKPINLKQLLDRWLRAYAENLRPKLMLGKYERQDLNLQKLQVEKYDAYWGGEFAAEKLTNYLRAEVVTLYVPDNEKNIEKIKYFGRLKPAQNGKVELVRTFWNTDGRTPGDCVHPVLIYADLIATGDPRSAETAEMIYEQYLARHFSEA